MTDFRPETFLQYIKKTKHIWFLKAIWTFALVFLVVIFLWKYNVNPNVFWAYFIFILVGLTIQALFTYWTSYKIYNLGRQAFLQINTENIQILTDIDIYIKGFDIFSKKSFFNIDTHKPIYNFNKADLLLTKQSMILLGKSKQFGGTLFASPVEIVTSNAQTSIANSRLLEWIDKGDRLQIEINDDYYTKPIKIEFKNHYEEIKLWLTRYCQKRG